MLKLKHCPECGYANGYDYFCDNCEKDLLKKLQGVPLTVEYSYGHDLDGTVNHFCSNECLISFHVDEINKQTPDDRFITGKEK